jgi:hypothetical protein
MLPGMAGNGFFTAGGGGLAASTIFLWRGLDATPVDEVSLATGTLVGNAYVDTTNGWLMCDGTGDWLTFPGGSIDVEAPGDWTFECHVQGGDGGSGLVARSSSGNSRFILYNGPGTYSYYASAFPGEFVVGSSSANGSVRHVAIVRDGNTWRQYIDGVQQDTETWTGAHTTSSDNLYIGADPFNLGARDTTAKLGRVKFSNVCLYPSGTSFASSIPSRFDP